MKKIYILIVIVLAVVSCTTKTDGYLGEPTAFVSSSEVVSGSITDSQTGRGLALVTISFTLDKSATTGMNAQYHTVTDQLGNFSMNNLPSGNYNVIIELTGYFTRILNNVEVANGQIQLTPQTIVQQPAVDSYRIVLTWGSTPRDLDAHFTGPTTAGSRFHIYFGNKTSSGASTNLDVDDTSSYGPETVTITSLVNGTYRYSVHNFTNQTTSGGSIIASSPAKVEIYNHFGLMQSFIAPVFTGNGNAWRVFELVASGANVSINPINTYIMATSYSDATCFVKPIDGSPNNNSAKGMIHFDIAEW